MAETMDIDNSLGEDRDGWPELNDMVMTRPRYGDQFDADAAIQNWITNVRKEAPSHDWKREGF
jgi:hypothetical protein